MNVFLEISTVLVIATALAGVMRLLKQPLIIGYIISGLIVGPVMLNVLKSDGMLETFSEMGVALLLFIVGLSLSPKVIKEVGKAAVVTGVGQVIFTTIIGYLLLILMNFQFVPALYISLSLTFSSTIIILKLLSDKRQLNDLHGKISIGFLLVQDIVATIILIGVTTFSTGEPIGQSIVSMSAKGLFLASIIGLFTIYVLPRLTSFFAKSQEFLFMFSISYGLGLASIFHVLGFSIEIGALTAGITLALFPYNLEIASKMRPLRDFFIVVFFILLGSQLSFDGIGTILMPAVILSLFVLIGNPLIMIILMGRLGFKKRVAFLSGLSVAQVSEFSLILVAMGVRVGHVDSTVSTLVTIVALITIAGSSYMITYAEKLYPYFAKYLSIFERKDIRKNKVSGVNYDVVLFGYNRIGYDFLKEFKSLKLSHLVVDYNPESIAKLSKNGVNCIYGDAGDAEFLDELTLETSKMIISTIPSIDINILITERAKLANENIIVLVLSHDMLEAKELYKVGASYVVIPHMLGGEYAASMISSYKFDKRKFDQERVKHLKYMENRGDI